MARHLIIGGSGFIGRHVALALLRRGDTVVIASRSPLKETPPGTDPALLSFVQCDLRSANWGNIVLAGDVVHHYAYSTIPETANKNPLSDLEVNVSGTLRLLDALRNRRGTRLIFPSSGGTVYGRLRATPAPEDHPLDPITAYGVSKVAIEKYLGFYRAMYGLDLRVARLSNPYGAGQNIERKQGAVSVFLHLALAGRPIEVWGDGSVIRDYIHITDAAAGLLALADAPRERVDASPIFNIGSGKGVSVLHILDLLEERLGRTLEVRYSPNRPFDVPSNVLDIRRAGLVLGWTPKLSFHAGLDLAIRDHLEGNMNYASYEQTDWQSAPFVSEDGPPESQPAAYHLALAEAHRKLGEIESSALNYRAALSFEADLPAAHTGLAELRMPGEGYLSWLERIYTALAPETALEIGVFQGQSLTLLRPPTIAIAIDPNATVLFPLKTETHFFAETSDEFFARRRLEHVLGGRPLSVAFIDGLHLYEQVLREFIGLEAFCGPRSVVLLHDTVPLDEATQSRTRETGFHTGDVWRAVLCLKHYRNDLDIFTIATPPSGLTVITGLDPTSRLLSERYEEAVARFSETPYSSIKDNLNSFLSIIPNDWSIVETHLKERRVL